MPGDIGSCDPASLARGMPRRGNRCAVARPACRRCRATGRRRVLAGGESGRRGRRSRASRRAPACSRHRVVATGTTGRGRAWPAQAAVTLRPWHRRSAMVWVSCSEYVASEAAHAARVRERRSLRAARPSSRRWTGSGWPPSSTTCAHRHLRRRQPPVDYEVGVGAAHGRAGVRGNPVAPGVESRRPAEPGTARPAVDGAAPFSDAVRPVRPGCGPRSAKDAGGRSGRWPGGVADRRRGERFPVVVAGEVW